MKNPNFALVTGASEGLGRVFARALASRGQNVILVARSRDKLESLANELRQSQSVIAEVIALALADGTYSSRNYQRVVSGRLSADSLCQPVFSDEIVSNKFLFGASGRTAIDHSERGDALSWPASCG